MAKLPESFEKDYVDLLTPVVSDGTTKNRRNLVVASFIISVIYLLDKSLTELSVFGLDLDGSDSTTLLAIAVVLILFWAGMFIAHAVKDAGINRERKHLLEIHVNKLKKQFGRYVREREENTPDPLKVRESSIETICNQLNRYTRQQTRILSARIISKVAGIVDYGIPIVLAVIAILFLGVDIYKQIIEYP